MDDPRGPCRTIDRVEESPTGGPTVLLLSPCGHRVKRVNHFHYRVGDRQRCFTCKCGSEAA